MKTTPLIFCAGAHKRWGAECKQLVDIDGEVLLNRTVRQLRAWRFEPLVITQHQAIHQACFDMQVVTVEPLFRYWLVESIMSTIHTWSGRVVCLLGDVVWSDASLERVLFDQHEVACYGDTAEVFALAWDSDKRPMLPVFRQVRKHALTSKKVKLNGRGKLWNIYRALEGKSMDKHQLYFERDVFVKIEDWTQDMDTREVYDRFCEQVVGKGLLGDHAR